MPNPGLIWLDEADAQRAIAERARARELSGEEEANLRKFAADGAHGFANPLQGRSLYRR